MDVLAVVVRVEERPLSGAVSQAGERTGVAVGEDAVTVVEQARAQAGDLLGHLEVLAMNRDALIVEQGNDVFRLEACVCRGHGVHAIERPAEVDRGGTRRVQEVALRGHRRDERVEVRRVLGGLPGEDVIAVAGTDADGGCATHLEELDGIEHLLPLGEVEMHELVGEKGLVDDGDRRAVVAQPDGLVLSHRRGDRARSHASSVARRRLTACDALSRS